jgi:hypothetical protein
MSAVARARNKLLKNPEELEYRGKSFVGMLCVVFFKPLSPRPRGAVKKK